MSEERLRSWSDALAAGERARAVARPVAILGFALAAGVSCQSKPSPAGKPASSESTSRAAAKPATSPPATSPPATSPPIASPEVSGQSTPAPVAAPAPSTAGTADTTRAGASAPPDPRGETLAPGARALELWTDDDVRITATLWPSDDDRRRAVVLVHQLSSDRYEWTALIKELARPVQMPDGERRPSPATVLALDLRGHGASTVKRDGTRVRWRDFDADAWKQIELDVRAAVSYLRGLPGEPLRIAIIGSSIGSTAAVRYAASDPDIRELGLLSPGLHYRKLATEAQFKAWSSLPGYRSSVSIAAAGDKRSAAAVKSFDKAAPTDNDGYHKALVIAGRGHGVAMLKTDPGLIGQLVDLVTAAD